MNKQHPAVESPDEAIAEVIRMADENPNSQAALFAIDVIEELLAGEVFEAVVPDEALPAIRRFARAVGAMMSAEKLPGAIRVRLEPARAA